MTALAVERLTDPLVTPLLALLKDACNAELAEQMEAAGLTAEEVVKTVKPYPVNALQLSAEELPVLACYRIRQTAQRRTFVHRDQLCTLRLHYVTSATTADRLDERWPILDRVWRAAYEALCAGHHEDHEDDERVLENAGVVWVNEAASKAEGYLAASDYAYPQWEADVQVLWRDHDKLNTDHLYPVLSLHTRITQAIDGDPREPAGDVVFVAYTPTGLEALDEDPFEEESEL